ncbi:MAG: DUF3090 family protein [Chloroflexi bacterium]|nr:DUF3090 family protein [Chloroflexota bacterium]MCI0830669.1 DUF3090 family protein [Chloroflexota bacterium]MCI0863288.1 DUF3090 family protein [Chloroflexota bacterium]MCI0898082.1 DUF3090 family protein [Chloroflexota bacterium]
MITIMESNKVKYPLGAVADIEVLTFGEPGLRTFRLDARSGAASCSIWMEKEQIFQLGVYLRDMVGHLSQEQREKESDLREEAWSGGELTVDFKAGQMLLSYDQDSNAFYLQAHERESEERAEEESRPSDEVAETESVGFWITTIQAGALGEEALKICAAGRPTCFLCGQPINPDGHVCPRANGHTVLEAG